MGEKTNISWTDSSWNPWLGCTKVGPGCDHCYAETLMDTRYGKVEWGAGKPRVRTSAANWRKPVQWNARDFYECQDCGWRGEYGETDKGGCGICPNPSLVPARRRVFCASLADVFDNEVDPQWRVDLFALIHATPNLDWLLLTKRIGNVAKMVEQANPLDWGDALPSNVWLGATVVNQDEADRDIPKLLEVPASVRFLSCEPLLGALDARNHLLVCCRNPHPGNIGDGWMQPPDPPTCCGEWERGIDWVIAGGESGQKARPMNPDWVRSLRDQCQAAGVAFHHKQNGEFIADRLADPGDHRVAVIDGLRMSRVGKKAAGRLLDGREWNEFPQAGA